ncbi:MAG: GNAT family N-acetyltransferase [Bacteriovoracaceae bacterium]|nr:GNAT family N-acetyltransferase [Bacteriovoracaceae bacterium]
MLDKLEKIEILKNENHILIKTGSIELKTINRNDIEMIRHWRNLPHVRTQMIYQNSITEEEQIAWFNKLDITKNYYFIISHKKQDIGLVNLKNIEKKDHSAEYGLFIGEISALNSGIGLVIAFLINHFAFSFLELDKVYATVLKSNKTARKMNEMLGFKALEDKLDFETLTTSKEEFYASSKRLSTFIKAFQKIN